MVSNERGCDVAMSQLEDIETAEAYDAWVRSTLRPLVQHAAFLGTLGNLYGLGSVPTHRISVDFPLEMIEVLKSSAGALDDPLIVGWFQSQKPRFFQLGDAESSLSQGAWHRTLLRYGIRSMMIHGVMDHDMRRFAIFQICNAGTDDAREALRRFAGLVPAMAKAAWRTVDSRVSAKHRSIVGHPTLSLTPTELQIVEMLARGMSNKEIARRRGVSDSTIKTQVQRTGAKIGATRRAEIVALAMPMLRPLPPQSMVDYDDFV